MPRPLPPGLYESLVTRELQDQLADLDLDMAVALGRLDPDAAPHAIGQSLRLALVKALRSYRDEDRLTHQIELANRVLELIRVEARKSGLLPADDLDDAAQLLLAITERSATLASTEPPARPRIPLRSSDLLVNGPNDVRIGAEIGRELASADRVDLLLSFLKWSGLRVILDDIEAFLARRPGGLRVLTTTYMGATDPRALDRLQRLGAKIRVSYDSRRTRLHAKAWLFHRESGFSTAFIGSSNLSAAALLDGLEWNVRLSAVDNGVILDKFRSTFTQYWNEGDFTDYDHEEFAATMRREQDDSSFVVPIRVRPYAHQREILEALTLERYRDHRRNLVVAATGTGKTIVAALDYKRLRAEHGDLSLLFVAHRKEILEQARQMFRVVLQDGSFGELLVGGLRPYDGRHVFASVQSLHGDRLESVEPDAYDMVIVDEFHHAAAPTYERLLGQLAPRYLLGLTATPERTDGQSVLGWFDHRVAAELRLWTALDRGLLSPFQYFGISDGTDLSRVGWRRGGYVVEDLENVFTGDDARVDLVLRALKRHIRDPHEMRALCFCVGVRHAQFLASRFVRAGLPAAAVHAGTPSEERREALSRLRDGSLCALFAVDLFNEGVDVPDIDTVLFLRPTESVTVFLQQLGRGLRLSDGKECLTVLDFIGNAHRRFRFDARYRAILGGTRKAVADQIEDGFPRLPAGCSMQLDRQARESVLANVRSALRMGKTGLVEDLRELGDVGLGTFLAEAGFELGDVYRGGGCFSDLRRAAGLPTPAAGPEESRLARALGRLIHVDDPERIEVWGRWLAGEEPPEGPLRGSREEHLLRMLFVGLGNVRRPLDELPAALEELWAHPAMRAELDELLGVLDDRLRRPTYPVEDLADVPLRVHGTYALDEITAGFGIVRSGKIYRPRGQGVWYDDRTGSDLLFVTLEKTEDEYSPTTMYADYPLSSTEFHWETQNTTTPTSKVGRRYVEHGSRVLLFVRAKRKDDRGVTVPYLFLGRGRSLRHEGERPMRIVWGLERAMPGGWFEGVKVAAG
jgi:superfamily II DNA or RNA helicase